MSKEMWMSMQERERAPARSEWQLGALSPWAEFGVVLPAALRNGDISATVAEHEGTPKFGPGIDVTREVALEMRAAARAANSYSHD